MYLFILLTSVLSKFMAGAPLDPEDVSNTLGAVAEGGRRFQIGVVLDLVSHVSVVALAGALYLAFSPYNRSLALLGMLWRVAEGVIIAFSEVNNVVFLSVAQKFVSATGAEAVALETMGRTLILAEDWGIKIGLAAQVERCDVATPMTIERYTGNWQGNHQGWLPTTKTFNMRMSKTLPGLGNFYMAGQWIEPGSGLPQAAMSGRYVTQIICKKDKRAFVTTVP